MYRSKNHGRVAGNKSSQYKSVGTAWYCARTLECHVGGMGQGTRMNESRTKQMHES